MDRRRRKGIRSLLLCQPPPRGPRQPRRQRRRGKDATEEFYGLHRHEVIERPQYAHLQIGVLQGEKSAITGSLIAKSSAASA